MGPVTLPTSGRIYVDAQVFIYTVEKIPAYFAKLRPLWEALRDGRIQLQTSEITIMEVLVVPLRDRNLQLVDDFRRLLAVKGLDLIPMSRKILESAAGIRAAQTKIKAIDAIHAATAIDIQCDDFLTNDFAFRNVPGLSAIFVNDL